MSDLHDTDDFIEFEVEKEDYPVAFVDFQDEEGQFITYSGLMEMTEKVIEDAEVGEWTELEFLLPEEDNWTSEQREEFVEDLSELTDLSDDTVESLELEIEEDEPIRVKVNE